MKKVLIANRGEIAIRVIRACRELGLATVAIFSEADREALHVMLADEAVCVGEAPSSNSYLKIARILAAAEITGADAIHPGYGFLSENAQFAELCETAGLNFIGPNSKTIALMGDKAQAKALAKSVGAPVIEGSEGVLTSVEEAITIANKVGYPVLLKAVAGGGGKGIRIAAHDKELATLYCQAEMEAEACFGNAALYLEKLIVDPTHIEVQILGDKQGNLIHLGERDCTIQRRRQKLIEEAPSPKLNEKQRTQITAAAVDIAKAARYFSTGTIEMLLDKAGQFYFMEMNTRIQVEHTVTEELTGIDLVQAQLKIAKGEKLPWRQQDIHFSGHVIEFRINAEDPANNFSPTAGKLDYFIVPGGPHVRVDTACYGGGRIPPHYDSMIAKLIVKGADRQAAMAVGRRALPEFIIRGEGIKSTIPFHLFMLNNPDFINVNYDIKYIDRLNEKGYALVV